MEGKEVAEQLGWPIGRYAGRLVRVPVDNSLQELRDLTEAQRQQILEERRFWDSVALALAQVDLSTLSAERIIKMADQLTAARSERFGGLE